MHEFDAIEKVWRCTTKLEPIFDLDSSIGLYIFNNLKNNRNKVLQISDTDKREVTNEQLLTWSVGIAKHLRTTFALDHTDVVAIAALNETYTLPIELACLFNATPFHGFNHHLSQEILEHVLGITKPKLVFCDAESYERIQAATISFQPKIYTISDHVEGVPTVEDLFMPLSMEAVVAYEPIALVEGDEQTIAILCSSGTSGPPKAVCVANNVFAYMSSFVGEKDVIYGASSIDWGSGLHSSIMPCLTNCTRVLSTKSFTPEYFIELVEKYKITYATLVYFHAMDLLNAGAENLDSLRLVYVIGAKVSVKSLQRLQKLFKNAKILLCYGLTEYSIAAIEVFNGTSNSPGKLLPMSSACIVDDNDRRLGPNEAGEICLKTERKIRGYYNNPEATKTLLGDTLWMHTGDIGYFDDDQQLHVTDRKSDICRYRGIHYSPTELAIVISELNDVIDVCVIGVPRELYGEAATAAVIKRPDSQITAQDIIDYVQRRLEVAHKQLHGGVLFFDQLPYNRNGKQIRREIAKMIQEKTAENGC